MQKNVPECALGLHDLIQAKTFSEPLFINYIKVNIKKLIAENGLRFGTPSRSPIVSVFGGRLLKESAFFTKASYTASAEFRMISGLPICIVNTLPNLSLLSKIYSVLLGLCSQ